MTYTYRCIGKGTTDSNGVAHITHDCSGNALSDDGYKGVGAGLLDILASTDSPSEIGDGSFQSETFEIYDCNWYDLGTDSTNSMFGTSSSMTVTYGDEYCSLTETTSGTDGVVVTNASHYIQPNDVFEFDFMQVDGSPSYAPLYVRNKTNGSSLATLSLQSINRSVNTWIHLKCQISGSKMYVYVDDSTTPIERTMSNTDTDYRLYWTTSKTNTELRFKNFKVYKG